MSRHVIFTSFQLRFQLFSAYCSEQMKMFQFFLFRIICCFFAKDIQRKKSPEMTSGRDLINSIMLQNFRTIFSEFLKHSQKRICSSFFPVTSSSHLEEATNMVYFPKLYHRNSGVFFCIGQTYTNTNVQFILSCEVTFIPKPSFKVSKSAWWDPPTLLTCKIQIRPESVGQQLKRKL